MASARKFRPLLRVILYTTVLVILYLNRGGLDWNRLVAAFRGPGSADTPLIIAGRDLAPDLIDRLIGHYRQEYPDLEISAAGGGTNQALEDLLNGTAGAAFLYRRPTPVEDEYFRAADGDTAIVAPIAVGGVILLAGGAAGAGPVTLDEVRLLLGGQAGGHCERFYVPEPNEGLWDAVHAMLDLDIPSDPAPPFISFLANAPDVLEAVRNDSHAWGMVSSLNGTLDPDGGPPKGLRIIPVVSGPGNQPFLPTYENVAAGTYPLHHFLYLACRENGNLEGGKFLTHLTSARGLRQVERAGALPARQILREIHLTTKPLGE